MDLNSVMIAGIPITFAPANCRPPGTIASQTTDATGVWARGGDGPWFKTKATPDQAWRIARKAKSAAEAMETLTATPVEPATTTAADPAKPEPAETLPIEKAERPDHQRPMSKAKT